MTVKMPPLREIAKPWVREQGAEGEDRGLRREGAPEGAPGTDADKARRNGREGRNAIEGVEKSDPDNGRSAVGTCRNALPSGFELRAGGLWYADPAKDDPPLRIASELRVTALTRNERGEEWGRLLEWKDADGRRHEWACPMELLAGDGVDFRRQLLGAGLEIAPGTRARNLLGVYVQACRPEARAISTARTGWHRLAYVLPDGTIGEAGGERVLLQTLAEPPSFSIRGTAEDWAGNVGRLCAGNSRLVFAVSMAFAAPLLHIVGEASGGVNLVGPSSTGKTTALRVAASIWGAPEPLRTWRATTNGLEGVAALHNDNLLVLDELGEIDPREAGAAAYMLANGAGKARARRDGLARPSASWRLLFLSSGEVGLADHMAEGGRRARAGQEVRLADVPADAGAGLGLFEDLHGAADGAAFAGALLDAVRACDGAAGREYLRRLVRLDREDLRRRIAEALAEFVAEALPAGADGQARRVAERFGLIAAAGALATALGLTGWPEGAAHQAALACFRAWLDRRGGAGSAEERAALAAVDRFLALHGASRFQALDALGKPETRVVPNRAGWTRKVEGRRQYLFAPEVFRAEVCAGLDWRAVLEALRRRGRLVAADGRNRALKLRGIGRVYAIWEEATDED